MNFFYLEISATKEDIEFPLPKPATKLFLARINTSSTLAQKPEKRNNIDM